MATAKPKRKVAKVARKFTFKSRDNSVSKTMEEPLEGNKASAVLFSVLNTGKAVPEGLKLSWAPSYKGTYISRKGKNACGSSNNSNLLVVNGIADELVKAGVKGVIQPTAKPYKAISVKDMDSEELKTLAKTIAQVLGFTGVPKKTKKSVVEAEVAVDEVAELA